MADIRAFLLPEKKAVPAKARGPELGDLVVEYLEEIGVEYVFGVPGGAIEPLYNAMARSARRGGLRPIVARHEAGAAFMADGYARETGKLGVCCATTGPGATNLITGVASAYMDNTPLLVLTAQTHLHQFGKQAFQESSCTAVNTVAMFQECTRYSSLVSHRGQMEGKLISAILAALGPPAGPAHLSLPIDVLSSPRRNRVGDSIPRFESLFRKHELIDREAVEILFNVISNSRKTVIVIGEDCGDATPNIIEIAELLQAPFVSGPTGKRWVNHFHPLYRGVLGFAGHENASKVFLDVSVDLVLAFGTRFSNLIFGQWEGDVNVLKRIVQIDTTSEFFSRSSLAHGHIFGNVKLISSSIASRLRRICKPKPVRHPYDQNAFKNINFTLDDREKCKVWTAPIKPQALMTELANRCPENTRFIIDTGSSWGWSIHYLFPRSSGHFRASINFGAMGWAIGAAVGTALGAPNDSQVVCITGDGSWLMNGQEITVAVSERLPVIFVVLNDQALGMVKHGQRLGGAEEIGYQLPPIDFAQMAKAMGAEALSIDNVDDLKNPDIYIKGRNRPLLLDVHIDPNEVPPTEVNQRRKKRR